MPFEALGLLAANRLDRDLFDVTALLEDGVRRRLARDAAGDGRLRRGPHRRGRSDGASLEARSAPSPSPGWASPRSTPTRSEARAFWADLTTGEDAAGNPTALADGAARVDLDGRVKVALEDSVPQIHAPEAWAAGYDGTGATVAVLDTGYDPTHPDLKGRVATSENFTTDATVTDGNGHGTHVASTVAGSGAASDGLRKGVAPGAEPDDRQGARRRRLRRGLLGPGRHGLGRRPGRRRRQHEPGRRHRRRHATRSSQAVNELSATSDTLFVIAAGNNGGNGPSTVSSPGSADAALTVGAVDVHDVMAGFSSRGPRLRDGALKPEVVAPGVDVTAARAAGTELGPVVDEVYTTISGTSMATPHVAGLAAILKQEHPTWDGEQLKSAIANSTVPVADATGFDAGTGRVDALAAIHQDVLAPGSLSLGSYAWPYSDLAPTRTTLDLHQHRRRAGDPVARPDRSGRRRRADRLDDAGRRPR